jgi:lipopolysaccharide/colanic/teichoic acid biosynthesis glycosyltransferase
MEVALCGLGLVILSPLFLIVAVLIKLNSRGPVFFRQRRVGHHGRPFGLIKFRSMTHEASRTGPLVTASGDRRVTLVGRLLRGAKIDELPQLWNVVRGDMSLVGPRPEVPRYVEAHPELFALSLQQRPGITDVCTLHLRNEEQVLATAEDPERYYVEKLLPRKLAASIREGLKRNAWRDLRIILATVIPPLQGIAPLPDFRPLAELYTLSPEQMASAGVAGGPRQAVADGHTRARRARAVSGVRVGT